MTPDQLFRHIEGAGFAGMRVVDVIALDADAAMHLRALVDAGHVFVDKHWTGVVAMSLLTGKG